MRVPRELEDHRAAEVTNKEPSEAPCRNVLGAKYTDKVEPTGVQLAWIRYQLYFEKACVQESSICASETTERAASCILHGPGLFSRHLCYKIEICFRPSPSGVHGLRTKIQIFFFFSSGRSLFGRVGDCAAGKLNSTDACMSPPCRETPFFPLSLHEMMMGINNR